LPSKSEKKEKREGLSGKKRVRNLCITAASRRKRGLDYRNQKSVAGKWGRGETHGERENKRSLGEGEVKSSAGFAVGGEKRKRGRFLLNSSFPKYITFTCKPVI